MNHLSDYQQNYKNLHRRSITLIATLFIFTLILTFYSLRAGISQMTVGDLFQTLMKKGSENHQLIIWNLRLPRTLAAILCGAGLGVTGCIMQNNLKNPLASPQTLGVTNAAAFGANVAILLLGGGSFQSGNKDAVTIYSPVLVTWCAFLSALLSIFIILAIAQFRSYSANVIILAGMAVSSLFGAGTIFLQYFGREEQVSTAIFWTFGNLGRARWNELLIMGILIGISLIYFQFKAWDYNALLAGNDSASSLGVNTKQTRIFSLFIASIVVAVCVSFLGIISFVGLIAPQIMRRIIGNDHRFLIGASAIAGSFVLLLSDIVARTIVSPIIMPIGVITSVIGAPLFLYILIKDYK